MENFTTLKDAQIIDISGVVQTGSSQNTVLQKGDSLAAGNVLTFAQDSEITLVFDDGAEQIITGTPDETLATNDQISQQASTLTTTQVLNEETPENVQADIDAIQALIESGDDVDLPDTSAGGLTGNEGTDFVTLERQGNELLAGAGYDTAELDNTPEIDNTPEAADGPLIVDPIDDVNTLPDAVDDTFGMNENTQLTGTLLGNDDLGDGPTTVTSFDSASVNGGAVTVDEAGNFTYTPATDFVGTDTFTYTITDADGDTSTATVTVNVANVNALADAVDDTFGMNENTQLTGTLLGNDDLGDGPTTVTSFDSASVNGATVTVDEAGNFTYTPAADFVGADTFTYTITDADGDTSTATVTVNVANVNALADAVDDTFGMNENTQLTGTLLGNDDLGDGPTTVTSFDSASVNGGAVTVDEAGNFTYTPATDFVGTDTFTYTITDADGDTSTATVTVNVANVNALADAVDDTFGMNENTQLTGTLLGNDDLGDGPTTVTSFDSASVNGATVTVDEAGNFTYTPAADFVGADTFTYTITDADGDTSTATVTVNVANVNALADAVDDTFGMNENTQLTGTLLGNDDLGDGPTTVTSFDSASVNGGAVTVDEAGNFTYTPAADFVGADTFTYTITDADGDTSTATVTVNVANVNALADAVDDTFGMNENTQLTGTLLGNDDLGDGPTTVTSFDSASVNGGAVTVDEAGNFTYTPATDFVGTDTFTYTITDADGDTSTATVTVNVANVNALADAVDDTFGMNENTQLTGTLLGNDDLGDGPTTVTSFDSASVNGATVTVDEAGNFTYTPAADFVGADTFTYTITDADGDTSTATVTVNVANVNALADAVDDTFGMNENTQLTGTLLGNDDLGDGPTTVTSFDSASVNGATVTVDEAGNFTYTPAADFVGADTFTYTITDADGDTSTATVTVNVANVNALADAVDDTFGMNENTQLTGTLLGNDDLGDGPTTVTSFDSASVNGGAVTVDEAGNFTYTPAADFVGADTFTYTITDADGDTSTATVTVNVANVNALADAVDDTFGMNENTQLTGTLLGNDDLGDGPTTVTSFDSASVNGATVTVDEAGNFTYTPAADFVGADTFTYTITDADGDTSTATVTINVNDQPEAVADVFSMNEGTTVSGNILNNDLDQGNGPGTVTQLNGIDLTFDATDGGYATLTIIDGVIKAVASGDLSDVTFDGTNNNGILRINADGNFTYENKGFLEGSDALNFVYTLSDTDSDISMAAVTIAVNTLAPTAIDDFNSTSLFTVDGATVDRTVRQGDVVARGSSGDAADSGDADDAAPPTITQVEYDGKTYNTFIAGTDPLLDGGSDYISIDTGYGTLNIHETGFYQFITYQGTQVPGPSANLVFTYTIQDDDDTSPETATADLTISVRVTEAEEQKAPEPSAKSVDLDLYETSDSINTDFDAKALMNADEANFKYSPELDDLSDILTDVNTDGLETYLAAMGEDESGLFDIDLAATPKDYLVEAVILEKSQNDSDNGSFTTVTNGLLAGGGTMISDQGSATNAPIPEFDSPELL
nr:retention module-containing protein [uncultured Glaciecola sp.]